MSPRSGWLRLAQTCRLRPFCGVTDQARSQLEPAPLASYKRAINRFRHIGLQVTGKCVKLQLLATICFQEVRCPMASASIFLSLSVAWSVQRPYSSLYGMWFSCLEGFNSHSFTKQDISTTETEFRHGTL